MFRRYFLFLIFSFFIFTLIFPIKLKYLYFAGNITVSDEEIKSAMKETVVGGEFNEEAFKRDLKRIFDLGYFSRIDPKVKKLPYGVGIVIYFEENPPVTGWRVFIEGPKVVDEKELEEEVVLEKQKALSITKLKESMKRIAEYYKSKGYFLVDIKSDVNIESGELVVPPSGIITFTVRELLLWDLKLKGDKRDLTEEEIKKILGIEFMKDTYENIFTRFFMRRVNYFPKTREFQYAYTKLLQSGFFGPETKITFENVKIKELSNDHLVNMVVDVQLNPVVEEGKEVKTVKVEGVTLLRQGDVLSQIESKPGSPTDLMRVLRDSYRIRKYYEENDYPLVGVRVNYDENEKSLIYRVAERYVDNVSFEGITKTKEYIPRAYTILEKGKPLQTSKLQRTVGALQNSEYFENVNIIPQLHSADSTLVDISIILKEKRVGNFGGTISWGMPEEGKPWYTGFAGGINFGIVNPFGYGQKFSFDAKLGEKSDISLKYDIPRILASPFDVSAKVYYKTDITSSEIGEATSTFITYNEERYGLSLTTVYNIHYDHSVSLTGRWESFTKESTQLAEPTGDTRSVELGYKYDTRDNFLDPRFGTYVGTTLNVTGFGGTEEYVKMILEIRNFFELFPDHVIALRGSIGGIYDVKSTMSLNVGSAYTVRGYDFTLGTGRSGDYEYILNSEYRLKLQRFGLPITLVAFYDQGFAGNSPFTFFNPPYLLSNSLYSFGIGARFHVPFVGIVRLDWAFPLIEENWYEKGKVIFAFGNMF